MLPEQTIMNSLIDIVVRGEGEESFLKIVTALKCGNSLNDIPNIWWKDNDKVYSTPTDGLINLDNLPPLPYQLLDFEKYIEIPQTNLPNCKRIIEVYTERGCCHRCGFCYNINMHQCKWRALAASKVVEQIECLVKNFALDGINFNADNLFSFETSNLIIPLGVIIFSFGGFNVMTQIEQITNGDKNLMVKTSVIGMFIPFIFFLAFSTLMLGVFGNNIADIATESLTGIIGIIGNTIAFLAMTSSYIISGLLLKDMLIDDYNIGKTKSTLLAMFSPFIFILIASPNFINTLAFTGALLSGLFAIIVAFAVIKHRKIIRKKYYETPGGIITPIFTILFFIIGIISIIID